MESNNPKIYIPLFMPIFNFILVSILDVLKFKYL